MTEANTVENDVKSYDVLIAGGGPAGATAALVLARAGKRVLLLERLNFPRFRIGESLLPRNFQLLQELGVNDAIAAQPHVPKYGVEFGIGHETVTSRFPFTMAMTPGPLALNIERSYFDQVLLDAARAAGAEVWENATVKQILHLENGNVRLSAQRADPGGSSQVELHGRWLIDASGQATIVARHLGTRQPLSRRFQHNTAYYQHFDNVERPPGVEGGYPYIVMCDEGWFWIIPLNETKTSVGLVIDADIARQVSTSQNIPANRMLRWGMQRCPAVMHRCARAVGPDTNIITADFSYTCRPFAGPGFFMAGDAATFLDPIFSTGVCLGMMGGNEAARHVLSLLDGRAAPEAAFRAYTRFIDGSTSVYYWLIRSYYKQSFRELFLNGRGPMQVHRAIMSILAGHVFPKPAWRLRWRLEFFKLCMRLQNFIALCPRRGKFSLLNARPVGELPSMEDAAMATESSAQKVAAALRLEAPPHRDGTQVIQIPMHASRGRADTSKRDYEVPNAPESR